MSANTPKPSIPARHTHEPQSAGSPSLPDLAMVGWTQFYEAHPNGLSEHLHQGHFELCLINKGLVNWKVGATHFQLRPGTLFLTRPDELHGGESNRMDPCELFWMIFRLDSSRGSFGLSPAETRILLKQLNGLRARTCVAPSNFTQDFSRLMESLDQQTQLGELAARSLVVLLLQGLLNAMAHPRKNPSPSSRIQTNIIWMSQHLGEMLGVEKLAEQAGLRPSYYREIFRKETGFSPLEYLTLLKVQRAQVLLESTSTPITQLAFQLGYNSSQYFATTFRRLVGESPRDYRLQTKNVAPTAYFDKKS